ncbi:hypothetical protein JOD67_002453 [Tenggerimyces flavus]|nr:hypothetical protein [Tenggerimyces flavus]
MFQFDQEVANTRYNDRLREAHNHRVAREVRRSRKGRR